MRAPFSPNKSRPLSPRCVAKPAVFLDRDGTIVEDPGFLHEPARVKLLPGAAEAIRRLNDRGFLVVMVSNQSGIALGRYSVEDYQAVQRRLIELLKAQGARLDGTYYCPHYPSITGPCECRKPGVKLFREAQAALDIDFARSWWVGDRLSDVQPAQTLGGQEGGILVATGEGNLHQGQARALDVTVVADLAAAADEILRS